MKLVAVTVASVLIATQAFAGSYQEKCRTTNVPYQTKGKAKPEAVIGGAIIGGVVGKVVTGDDGAAIAGAVVGGVIGNETSKKTVTGTRAVTTCKTVYVPDRIEDEGVLRQTLQDLNDGKPVSKEMVMDAQYTIGVTADGSWGRKSQQAADAYLANFTPTAPLYSLVVNDVVITISDDEGEINELKTNLQAAGVDAQVIVDY